MTYSEVCRQMVQPDALPRTSKAALAATILQLVELKAVGPRTIITGKIHRPEHPPRFQTSARLD